MHYKRWKKHGDPNHQVERVRAIAACKVPGCLNETGEVGTARGLCKYHYHQWHRSQNAEKRRGHYSKRRALKKGAEAEDFQPLEVFDRDGWICQLCGASIPKSARWPDPQSVSLDHILPLSRGGEHTRVNVQASHLVCNLKKNASGTGDQLRLLG